MCGINGFNFKGIKIIQQMNKALQHRGPDNSGIFTNNNISLGHRRLSIIDLSKAASQPMTYTHKNKKFTIVYNGEIYNFKSIKSKLQTKGYKFTSNSDTEVILASYAEWGKECIHQFNGMWAFCIYDMQKQILFLSRDRLGQKPLYYYHNKDKFIFSSEIKGILKHKIPITINKDAIDLYFSLGFIPSPYSVYKEISKVKSGENILYDLQSSKLSKELYFKKPIYSPIYDKVKLIKEGKELIKDATKLRMISDVPLGAFLSGGIDSSTIVQQMIQEVETKNINTFSIGFEGNYDETPTINIVKEIFKTNHHHQYFKESDFRNNLDRIFYHYDEPFADPSIFPTMNLSQFARKKLTVALSGDGGDEIFGGYPRHQMAEQMKHLRRIPSPIRLLLSLVPNKKLKEGIRLSLLPKEKIFSEARPEIYKPKIYKKVSENSMKECLKLSKGNLSEAVLLYDRYFQTLGDNFLAKVDRASMAYGLEVRSPFLDYRFLEYSAKIPTKYKFSPKKNKILLRNIASKFLPQSIINQKKTGFTPPIEKWLLKKQYKKELIDILKVLHKSNLMSHEWYKFYKYIVFDNSGVIYNNFRIKLYLFYYWAKYWKIV